MKVSALKYTILTWVSGLVMLMLLLLPFYAFLTVWGASLFGHYTALRLWPEVLLALSIVGVLLLLATDHKIRSHTLTRRLVWLIFAYMGLNIVWGLLAINQHDVTARALGYGLIIDLRFLAFFLVTWAVALRMSRLRTNWQRLVYWPAAIVVLFGLLQVFVLPHDFLKHVGYGPDTIPAYATINSNHDYYRIASTLRGANPLGAYLLIPITLLAVLLVRAKRNWRQAAFLAGAVVVLFFSYSRSAWIGAALSVGTVLYICVGSRKMRRITWGIIASLAVIAVVATAALWNNSRFQNFVFHTETKSSIKSSSNNSRTAALKNGASEVASHPFGRGPGTAGPASVHNTGHPVRISENYFLQVGQETGWIGLGMFITINIGVGYLLWLRRADPLALSLYASLLGITLINMVSHAWADDTLAYIWWGLAGIAMAQLPQPVEPREAQAPTRAEGSTADAKIPAKKAAASPRKKTS